MGYGREEIVSAVAEQMNRLAFSHTFNGMTHEPVAKLSARILTRAPSGMRRVFFGNSGSDANDTAIKLVVLYNNLHGKRQKKKIVARWRGYHGVTVAAGSLTGLPASIGCSTCRCRRYGISTRPTNIANPSAQRSTMHGELEETHTSEGPDTVAAFIAEPVMGTGGVLVPPEDYFGAIREVLDRHDVLLILDEVICGFGRLGTWFGADRFNVVPDLMTTAKGLTSGYLPMSAVIIGEHVWSVIEASRRYCRGLRARLYDIRPSRGGGRRGWQCGYYRARRILCSELNSLVRGCFRGWRIPWPTIRWSATTADAG